ncbi:addiction module antidote protein [Aquirufa nivalisilvae]
MYCIEKTTEFDKWFKKLNDIRAKAKILFRIQKIEIDEHFGDCEPVGDRIQELKINYAKGYRVYFKEIDRKIIILLIGGNKSTQQKDIEKAKDIWNKFKKQEMETSKFDIADYLDNNEMIAEYLNTVLEEGNEADVITAIGHIAKAIGMTKIAEETGMSRPSLYKALSEGSKPQFSTIMKVLKAVGVQIHIHPLTT